MSADDLEQQEVQLGRYWDARVRGTSTRPLSRDLDPSLPATVYALASLDDTRAIDPSFHRRLRRDLMIAATADPTSQRLASVLNGRPHLALPKWSRSFPGRSRSWGRLVVTVEAAAIAVLILALVLGSMGREPTVRMLSGLRSGTPVSGELGVPYETLRIEEAGANLEYAVWLPVQPLVVPTPDGGAWIFFSAAPRSSERAGQTGRLYASRLDPGTDTWSPAEPLPGGEVQSGAAAVVAADGTVHLVYVDRANADDRSYTRLLHVRRLGASGWGTPAAVAPTLTNAHQLLPSLALDESNRLHVAWQQGRASAPDDLSIADVFTSTLTAGAWSPPESISSRADSNRSGIRPDLVVDGDRLVAIWSMYEAGALESAVSIEWSTRPTDGSAGWAPTRTLLRPENDQIGGRSVDLASRVGGGAVLVYGRHAEMSGTLWLRRLDPALDTWGSEISLGPIGDVAFPHAAVDAEGTAHVVYNWAPLGANARGFTRAVEVGATTLRDGAAQPGPGLVLTAAEEGTQGRPAIAFDAAGEPIILYLHEPSGEGTPLIVTEVRVRRGQNVPQFEDVPEATPSAQSVRSPLSLRQAVSRRRFGGQGVE